MRFMFAVFLMFAASTAFEFSCKVTCPPGYSGACVGNPNDGCSCSCEKESKNAKRYILESLGKAGASPEFRGKVTSLLANVDEFEERTLTDDKTGKQFTIMLKKQQ